MKQFLKIFLLLATCICLVYLGYQVAILNEPLNGPLLLKVLFGGLLYTLAVTLGYMLWFGTWRAILKKPFVAWGLIGGGGFLALAGVQAFIKKAEYYTAFQTPFIKPMIAFDVCIALLIGIASILKARSPQKTLGTQAKILFFVILNGFFLNMLTIPTGIEGWSQFLPFVILAGVLDLLLVGAWIEQTSKVE